MNDHINPQHYKSQPFECIEFTQNLDFCLGNAFKYIWRYKQKNGMEDLEKAYWYLEHRTETEVKTKRLSEKRCEKLQNELAECEFTEAEYNVLHSILTAATLKKLEAPDYIRSHTLYLLETLILEATAFEATRKAKTEDAESVNDTANDAPPTTESQSNSDSDSGLSIDSLSALAALLTLLELAENDS